MNELNINYGYTKSQKLLFVLVGGYACLYGLYNTITLALANNFTLGFYLALAAVILSAILILNATLWTAKPLFRMDSEIIYVSMPKTKTVYTAEWSTVKEVAIGISYLKLTENDGKEYSLDISHLKYCDLKEIKGRVIEICESKTIPYKND